MYGDLIIMFLSNKFVIYTLHDKHLENHTHGNLVFFWPVLSHKRLQAARNLSFNSKLWFKLTNYGKSTSDTSS
jgi:hypothetical protein